MNDQGGVQRQDWARRSGEETARTVLGLLEFKRVLSDPPAREDFESVRLSVVRIKEDLDVARNAAVPGGELATRLARLVRATVDFHRTFGNHSENYHVEPASFEARLTLWRRTVGQELTWMIDEFALGVPAGLLAVIVR